MYSAFGVDHGEFAKADNKVHQSSPGRKALAVLAPDVHPLVAGKKGKKLRAFGNELGGAAAGHFAGRVIGAATHNATAMEVGGLAGAGGGALMGLHRNERKGYLKDEN